MSTPLFTPRPTKYRAWDGKRMQIVHSLCWNQQGYLWYGAGNAFGWAYVDPDSQGWSAENMKPSEKDLCPVMQWTGLVDTNGRDIYEGDILSGIRHTRVFGAVSFGEFPGWEGDLVLGWRVTYIEDDPKLDSRYALNAPVSGVVLGNVFENPDLLKS